MDFPDEQSPFAVIGIPCQIETDYEEDGRLALTIAPHFPKSSLAVRLNLAVTIKYNQDIPDDEKQSAGKFLDLFLNSLGQLWDEALHELYLEKGKQDIEEFDFDSIDPESIINGKDAADDDEEEEDE